MFSRKHCPLRQILFTQIFIMVSNTHSVKIEWIMINNGRGGDGKVRLGLRGEKPLFSISVKLDLLKKVECKSCR